MEHSHYRDVVAVSRYWTPQHLDVTDTPAAYARPKPAWLDRLGERHERVKIDDRDRLARRRLHTGAVIDPSEIGVLPPITVAPQPPQRSLLNVLYGAIARRREITRVAPYARAANASGTGE